MRKRFFRGYPTDILEKSILDSKIILDENLGMTIRKKSLAKLWRISSSSSNYTSKINNMRYYGLTNARNHSEQIELSQLSREILEPGSKDQLSRVLQEAASKPPKFADFYKLLEDKKIPHDNNLKRIIALNISIKKELIDEYINIAVQNGIFSGLISEGDESLFVESFSSLLKSSDGTEYDNDSSSYEIDRDDTSEGTLENNKTIKFEPRIVSSNKFESISLKYFSETETILVIRNMFGLMALEFKDLLVSISDSIPNNENEYSVFIIDSDKDHKDIQFWMQLGSFITLLNENCLFISSFNDATPIPEMYKHRILKLNSIDKHQIQFELIEHLIKNNIININLS